MNQRMFYTEDYVRLHESKLNLIAVLKIVLQNHKSKHLQEYKKKIYKCFTADTWTKFVSSLSVFCDEQLNIIKQHEFDMSVAVISMSPDFYLWLCNIFDCIKNYNQFALSGCENDVLAFEPMWKCLESTILSQAAIVYSMLFREYNTNLYYQDFWADLLIFVILYIMEHLLNDNFYQNEIINCGDINNIVQNQEWIYNIISESIQNVIKMLHSLNPFQNF